MKLTQLIDELQQIQNRQGKDLVCFDASGSEVLSVDLEFNDEDNEHFVGIYS